MRVYLLLSCRGFGIGSKHFILLHNRDIAKDPVTKISRAEMRLDLLEQVYETFFLTFAFNGVYLRPPVEPMEVVLFTQHADFLSFASHATGSRSVAQMAGFYKPNDNVAIFYDNATDKRREGLIELVKAMRQTKEEVKRTRAAGAGEVIRLINALELLIDIEREAADVATVSHECVHQLAANTGMFPRDGYFIRWVHEGLASYFESSTNGLWRGAGVVDHDRIDYYRLREGDPVRGSLEFKASYSNKQLLYRLGDEKDPELPDAWLINAWVVEPEKDGLIPLKRSIEFAAGDHSGLQIDLSGDGSAWFDPELGVAKSGQIQFTAKQSIYCGVVDGYQMQVGFQWLEEWQQTLFDHYLVPNEKALDKENLARLTAKQISYITSLFNDSKPGSRWDPHDLMELHLYAPMPVDSQLYQVLRREQKRMNSGDQRGGTWYQLEVDIALNRWERVRKLGTLVPRIWKASVGNFQVKAQLVNANESLVTLRRYDNQQEIKVPLEKLSADDQEFVKIFGQGPAEAP